ncbi:hypothetical protein CSPX01_12946, partial [Colletotrichum filicis]
ELRVIILTLRSRINRKFIKEVIVVFTILLRIINNILRRAKLKGFNLITSYFELFFKYIYNTP